MAQELKSTQPATIKDQGEGVPRPEHLTEKGKQLNRQDGVDVAELANENRKFRNNTINPAGQAGG